LFDKADEKTVTEMTRPFAVVFKDEAVKEAASKLVKQLEGKPQEGMGFSEF
jgi:hypothetical protein